MLVISIIVNVNVNEPFDAIPFNTRPEWKSKEGQDTKGFSTQKFYPFFASLTELGAGRGGEGLLKV